MSENESTLVKEASRFAKAQYQFAINFYKEFCEEDKNFVFSPTSVYAGLSMVGAGADGATAAQVARALKVRSVDGQSQIHEYFMKLVAALTMADEDEDEDVEIIIANTFFMPVRYRLNEDFAKLVESKYLVLMQSTDFRRKRQVATRQINAWIAKQTKNKFINMVREHFFGEKTRLVVLNTVYVKGLWDSQFKLQNTSPALFELLDGSKRLVSMMHQKGRFRSGFSSELNSMILEIPYKGLEFSMDIVLPNNVKEFYLMQELLDAKDVEILLNCMGQKSKIVFVYLPRFHAEVSLSLHKLLRKVGIVDMFNPRKANLSGIGYGELYISAMFHNAYIVVDEEGNESDDAAADLGKQRHVEFRADHPFIYFIRHMKTGAILFIGRVTSPPESPAR